jgi:hypothetical protein
MPIAFGFEDAFNEGNRLGHAPQALRELVYERLDNARVVPIDIIKKSNTLSWTCHSKIEFIRFPINNLHKIGIIVLHFKIVKRRFPLGFDEVDLCHFIMLERGAGIGNVP